MTVAHVDEDELRRLCAEPGARGPRVAAALGVSIKTLRRHMKLLGIPPFPQGRPPTSQPRRQAQTERRQVLERVITCLRDLTPPHMAGAALERAAELIDKHPEHRGLFIVAGATFGPHLTSRHNVGGVVAKAEEPCLVIDLDLLPPIEQAKQRSRWAFASR